MVFSGQEIMELYNIRGGTKNSNKFIIVDLNLKYLPFMNLDTNTFFMYFVAICSILFERAKIILAQNKNLEIPIRVSGINFSQTKYMKRYYRLLAM